MTRKPFFVGTAFVGTVFVFFFGLLVSISATCMAADSPQWGKYGDRNMISPETSLPDSFQPGKRNPQTGQIDLNTTENVKWTAPLGSIVYGTPVIAEGRVFVGSTDSIQNRDQLEGDRGVLHCFDEKNGELLWELVVPKRTNIRYSDWSRVGICSPPSIESGKIYLVTNRCEVLCLDIEGQANGNDGPFLDEATFFVPEGAKPLEVSQKEADIIWQNDLTETIGAMSHNAANCSVLIDGECLYICTSNGVDWSHQYVMNPKAPTLVVLDKATGKILARDDFQLGNDIAHGQWSSPALGIVNGQKQIFLGTGSGQLFAVRALTSEEVKQSQNTSEPILLETIWKFHGHPLAQSNDSVPVDHQHDSTSYQFTGNPVFYRDKIFAVATQEMHHGMKKGRLICIDATKRGDITRNGGLLWFYDDISSSDSTVAISNDLLYVSDGNGVLHCLDVETGKPHWTHSTGDPIWASPLVADSKVFLGTPRRQFLVFSDAKEKCQLSQTQLPGPVFCSSTAANQTLYIPVCGLLYAIEKK
ncbi:MAG: PQQ-binding-like beta-propeller repeat protein [Thermoguttaceae bacterium]